MRVHKTETVQTNYTVEISGEELSELTDQLDDLLEQARGQYRHGKVVELNTSLKLMSMKSVPFKPVKTGPLGPGDRVSWTRHNDPRDRAFSGTIVRRCDNESRYDWEVELDRNTGNYTTPALESELTRLDS